MMGRLKQYMYMYMYVMNCKCVRQNTYELFTSTISPSYLPICLSIYLSTRFHLTIYLSVYLYIYLSIYLSTCFHLTIYLSIYLFIYSCFYPFIYRSYLSKLSIYLSELFIHLFIYLSIYPPIHLLIHLSHLYFSCSKIFNQMIYDSFQRHPTALELAVWNGRLKVNLHHL